MKTTNPTKKTPKKKKEAVLTREWFYFDEHEMPEAYALSVAAQMYDWAMNENAIKINDFLRQKKIFKKTIWRWCEKYPKFKDVYKECLLIIGDRREEHAFYKRGDSSIFLKSAHIYDDEWRAIDHYNKELKSDEEDKERPVNIYLGDVPGSELVEKRLKEIKDGNKEI